MEPKYISDNSCANCSSPLYKDENAGPTQYDNALRIKVDGGYGMFVESPLFGGPPNGYMIFCHDCAHELCDKFPGFQELINPYGSHSHRAEWLKENPDHEGWDI